MKLIKFEEQSQLLIKVIDGLFSIQRIKTYCCIWGKVLQMGHYIIIAHVTHLTRAKNFSFDTSIGRDIYYNEKETPLLSLFSINLEAVTLCMGQTHEHINFELNKVSKDFNKSWNFFQTVAFQCIMPIPNQGGNQTSRVSSMLQKTPHVAYGTKTSQG